MPIKKFASAVLLAGSIAFALTGCGPAMEKRFLTMDEVSSSAPMKKGTLGEEFNTVTATLGQDCFRARDTTRKLDAEELIGWVNYGLSDGSIFIFSEYIYKTGSGDEAKQLVEEISQMSSDTCFSSGNKSTGPIMSIKDSIGSNLFGYSWTDSYFSSINILGKPLTFQFDGLNLVAAKDEYVLFFDISNEPASAISKAEFTEIAAKAVEKFGQ
jgi:hypothetical protein